MWTTESVLLLEHLYLLLRVMLLHLVDRFIRRSDSTLLDEVESRVCDVLTHLIVDHHIWCTSDSSSLRQHTWLTLSLWLEPLNVRCWLCLLQLHPFWCLILTCVLLLILRCSSVAIERELDLDTLWLWSLLGFESNIVLSWVLAGIQSLSKTKDVLVRHEVRSWTEEVLIWT